MFATHGLIFAVVLSASVTSQPSDPAFGVPEDRGGLPLGGGAGYEGIVAKPQRVVRTGAELIEALKAARSGDVVYVDDAAEIDLTGRKNIEVPAGATLASGRGRDGSAGGLLFSTDLACSPLLVAGGPGVRVTGLRLRGPDDQRRTEQMKALYPQGKYYSIPNSDGILSSHDRLEVDNCEIWAWSHAGVCLRVGAKAHVHHNDIHHCQRQGLGYGVSLSQCYALVEWNRFDWCRHHIAGTGAPGTSYEARFNRLGEHANGHLLDMHGGADRKDKTHIAGDAILIHHNTFLCTDQYAVGIRGVPQERCEIHHNVFANASPEKAVFQRNAQGRLRAWANRFGAQGRVLDGPNTTTRPASAPATRAAQ